MPGLWDTHVHREHEIRFFADRTDRAQLAYGMTSTVAPGDVAYRSVENREAVQAGTRVGRAASPRASRSTASRTHLDHFRGRSPWPRCRSRCRAMRALQYDYLKTYVRHPPR